MTIRCHECPASLPTAEAALDAGWFLPVAGLYRCIECQASMKAASRTVGCGTDTPDNLPPTSRGALPKTTAHTIEPTKVKP